MAFLTGTLVSFVISSESGICSLHIFFFKSNCLAAMQICTIKVNKVMFSNFLKFSYSFAVCCDKTQGSKCLIKWLAGNIMQVASSCASSAAHTSVQPKPYVCGEW